MKPFDQLAIAFRNRLDQLNRATAMQDMFGATFSVQDRVRAIGFNDRKERIENVAELMFDYATWPMEYELLHYVSGWNWHHATALRNVEWLSHYGVHVESEDEIGKYRERYDVVQEVVTVEHANPVPNKNGRRYHYVIFDAVEDLGAHLKTIRRIDIQGAAAWLAERGL